MRQAMKNVTHETICCCALNRIFGFEPALARCLMDNLGSASAVFSLSQNELHDILGPHSKYLPLITEAELENSEKELKGLESDEYDFISIGRSEYPEMLKECPDAPIGIYVRSRSDSAGIFRGKEMISIVGTRDLSLYGSEWCRKIVGAISDTGKKPVIISGLALGIDITAHMCAIDCGLPTIGVMATGIDDIYPHRHIGHARRIAEHPDSALVSDYPRGTAPMAINFLRRNRIIAGMSRATILVESKIKGGGMITANLAFSYDRDVFALPGRIDDLRSEGCNKLIRAKVAEPIGNLNDLTKALGLGESDDRHHIPITERVESFYSDRQCPCQVSDLVELAGLIASHRGITPDEICSNSGRPYTEVAAMVCLLESDGFIKVDLLQRCSVNYRPGTKESR